MLALNIINLSKSFDTKAIPAFKELNFSIKKGAILSLFGPSGTGKSTLLKIISGELTADSGSVDVDGGVELVVSILDVDGSKTMSEIIGEKIQDLDEKEQIQRKREMIDLFSLFYKDQQSFNSLSLGEQKRVLLARSLATRPSLLLLDEPFSSLDLILKKEIKSELQQICLSEKIACLFVSHNFQDIMSFSDHVAILDVGQIRQIDIPEKVYDFPRDAHVAKLIQNANLIACEILEFKNDHVKIKTDWGEMKLPRYHKAINESTKRANILIYPHEIEISEDGFSAKVISFKPTLGYKEVLLESKERSLLAQFPNSVMIEEGQVLSLSLKNQEVRLIPL
jgi:ABC-type Fe3+/spermidine/putrescine transport system ATPase subunit